MNRNTIKESTRNHGIDLLRIVCMLQILMLHILLFNGLLSESFSTNNNLCWLLESISINAVNCYALITGYVGCTSKWKPSRFLFLWATTSFYLLLFGCLDIIFSATVQVNIFLFIFRSFFPMFTNSYWYFTHYFYLFLLIPGLNYCLNTFKGKHICICLSIITLYLFLFPEVANQGYSFVWLSVLYLWGGLIKKNENHITIHSSILITIYYLCITLTWLSSIYEFIDYNLLQYISPTIWGSSVILLLLFKKSCPQKTKKAIEFLSPLAFSVYLIHLHPFVYNRLITIYDSNKILEMPSLNMLLLLCLTDLALYIFCTLIDIIRKKIFDYFKILFHCKHIEKKFFHICETSSICKKMHLDKYVNLNL